MTYSSIITPKVTEGFVSRQTNLGIANYDLDELYSPDTELWKSKVLDLGSPKYNPNKTYWFDRSRYNNHGTITGAVWKQSPSGVWVISFDGTDDVINCGSATVLDNLGTTGNYKFTVVAWINPASIGETAGKILEKIKFEMSMSTSNRIYFAVTVATVSKLALTAVNAVPFGSWVQVVGVYDGAHVNVYTNTTKVEGNAVTGTIDSHAANSLLIGDNVSSNRCFDGLIGEIRAYDQIAFTQADVNRDRQATKWRYK